MILTETKGQTDLPRYFARVFALAQQMPVGRLDVVLADGRRFRAEGATAGPVAEVHIHDPDVFARLIREGELGFCDAYLDEGWSSPDLQAFLDLMNSGNEILYRGFPGKGLVKAFERLRHLMRSNSKGQARKNISYHYDLGNAFYAQWLDASMTYSSALFETGQESFESAQRAKYAALVDALNVKAGDHVLEIGCGWGGFAEYAAGERGLRVTGLTISAEQLKYAEERIEKAGLSHLVTLKMQDYRDETGQYDGIASIEMFEAVGETYWSTYFSTLSNCLRPGGKAALHVITIADEIFQIYKAQPDFIQRYIFPGGMLPSMTALAPPLQQAGLKLVTETGYAKDYARTLAVWKQQFHDAWPDIAKTSRFDERFKLMWELYLSYCEGGFKAGNIDVKQMLITHN